MTQQAEDIFRKIIHCENIHGCSCTCNSPCKQIINYQNQFTKVHWHTCEPWSGKLEEAPILFLLSNPSYSGDDEFPYDSNWVPPCKANIQGKTWKIADIENFFEYRFDPSFNYVKSLRSLKSDGKYGKRVNTWRGLCKYAYAIKYPNTVSDLKGFKIGDDNSFSVAGQTIMPGDDFAITEVVKCKSPKEIGVRDDVVAACSRHCKAVIDLFANSGNSKAICVTGEHAKKFFLDEYKPQINPDPAGSYDCNGSTCPILYGKVQRLNLDVYLLPHPTGRISNVKLHGIQIIA